MTNVIQLTPPSRINPQEARLGALLSCFARHRRTTDDVFWLKENAEVLNILECTGTQPGAEALNPYTEFYAKIEKRLQFFPQYYRFFLSITLDLEDLGMPGDHAERLIRWVADKDLPQSELSDLQRFEAVRLMTRRGVMPKGDIPALEARARDFMARSETFTLPNKKAAYELTHIVFYLSEYGRRDPQIDAQAKRSLHFAGLLAFIEQNADLLSEICIAMHYAGETPSPLWTDWLKRETALFHVEEGSHVGLQDDYHEFLVCNWHQAVTGDPAFVKGFAYDRMRFDHRPGRATPMREMSEAMLNMDARSGDWLTMRLHMEDALSQEAMTVLDQAETSSQHFADFFHGFARADQSVAR
ncbi:DUF6902 family protein [Marivita hallyeonensis]|uniref:Uncharacterized protein n=1 Tax=Marivita hallyeonensis TaxID=996342 RepID=A0A1M5QM84_9RHOB|nr:hypothetical protein [Marivita hallyeonensis]SHH14693.1 hypothetical protein SAMN05443551_1400 [Marivita hallyeonensis]